MRRRLTNPFLRRLLLLPGLALVAVAGGWIPLAQFPEETITIEVHPARIEVEGIYHYRNPWPLPITQGFTVPIAISSEQSPPPVVRVERLNPDPEPVQVLHLLGADRFQLALAPGETIRVRVRYEQLTSNPRGTYLLTTTRRWWRPLARACYRLVPRGVQISDSSIPARITPDGAWESRCEEFFPAADWTFAWEARS